MLFQLTFKNIVYYCFIDIYNLMCDSLKVILRVIKNIKNLFAQPFL